MGLKKKLFCGALAITLLLPTALPVDSYAGYFSDITGHWAEFHISKVYNERIISGYPDGRFRPDKAVTRAEFLAMVNETFELDDIKHYEAINFKDVSYNSWYYDAVAIAVAADYTGGYSDNTFKPNSPISRQEAMVMLSRLIPSGKKDGNLKAFPDYRFIPSWATEAMAKMNGKGYVGPYSDRRLHPSDSLTRAQTAKILSEILDNEDIIKKKTEIYDDKTELANKVYVGTLIIDESLDDGSVTIDNCIILGDLIIEGGGEKTVTINNSRVASASVNREDGKVRVVTKGNTVISKLEASESCYLQASSKGVNGFPDIAVSRMADVTLKGTFPKINIEGSRASVTLESGKIGNLTVTGAGRYSDITLSGKAEISKAEVNTECYFHGSGTIVYMEVNADDVTYETKPDKMLVGLRVDKPEAEGDKKVSVAFRPKSKDDDVDVDTKITVTFNTSMKMANGGEIKDSNINSIISFRKGSKSGEEVPFKGTINSAKKVITITPDAKLSGSTRYYILLEDAVIINAGGNKNDNKSSYFITEETDDVVNPIPPVTIPDAALQGITVSTPSGINLLSGFQSATKSYTVTVPATTTSVAITASADAAANPNAVITINGTASNSVNSIPLNSGSDTVVTIRISADNRNPVAYIITIR